jgi:stress response protein YsnF
VKLGNNLEQKNKKQLENAERQLSLIEGKKKDLLKVYLEKIITIEEFGSMKAELESEEINLKSQINKLSEVKFTNQQIEKTKQAFEELNKKGDDLYQVFKTLINKIIVHHNGDIEIEYTFTK